ncbi:flagellar basal body-associated FliL family protein [Calditerrivibrio nitroreducens]|uniref:Flagellar protein FliL n=1 Tax=Calditerrivibrio nitroreducens (strain DSM 19672 / NBRC 101217 / Yu37-1) TaxID=768670 RepID=E4TJP7_CALNY|nr:flagellar basal body-associated FliL family protein [Calditerrivibrio nitroreducens]ADR19243.1 flagellar basal body-associated protein FliL [Calditerrivibrio nitroreducens DSM 19672]
MAEEKEGKAEEGGGKKKSPLKLIIILVVVLVLLVGGGLAAYLFLFKSKSADHNAVAKEEKAPAKEEKAKKDKKSGEKAKTVVYSMGAIIVNLADQGVQRYLKVQIAVELDNPKLEEEVKKREPQIKDIIISVLSSKTVSDVNTPQGKIALKQEILKRANMVLTEGEITDLFFSEFIVQ